MACFQSWRVGRPTYCLWRVGLFSFKFPLSTIPNYIMQYMALPKKLLDNIDRVNRNFLWGSTNEAKKVHWVGWHKVTKSKEEGGLGI